MNDNKKFSFKSNLKRFNRDWMETWRFVLKQHILQSMNGNLTFLSESERTQSEQFFAVTMKIKLYKWFNRTFLLQSMTLKFRSCHIMIEWMCTASYKLNNARWLHDLKYKHDTEILAKQYCNFNQNIKNRRKQVMYHWFVLHHKT